MGENHQRLGCHLVRDHISYQLEKFWLMENYGEKKHYSREEEACERHFSENVGRDSEGKYVVRLPFKKEKKDLGMSYDMARRRFFALEKRLAKNSDLQQKYHQFMREYEELGHMELTTSLIRLRETRLTTKLRVVFNALAKTTTGISLNETMMVGPTIQDGIFTLVLRFRQHRIVLNADIEKMYRQFWVHTDDRKYQKILWRYNSDQPLKTYQLITVTYGTSAAPFLAVRCLKRRLTTRDRQIHLLPRH